MLYTYEKSATSARAWIRSWKEIPSSRAPSKGKYRKSQYAVVAPCLFCYQFEPVEDRGTIVSQEAVIHLTGSMLGLEEPVVTRVVRRQLEHDLLTLKDLLEASAATHQSAG